jgi:hypothetical protein
VGKEINCIENVEKKSLKVKEEEAADMLTLEMNGVCKTKGKNNMELSLPTMLQ